VANLTIFGFRPSTRSDEDVFNLLSNTSRLRQTGWLERGDAADVQECRTGIAITGGLQSFTLQRGDGMFEYGHAQPIFRPHSSQ